MLRFMVFLGITLITLGTIGRVDFAEAADSLYQRVGGRQGIAAITSDFVDMTLRDARLGLNSRSRTVMSKCKPSEVKARLAAIICEESGGPCRADKEKVAMTKSITDMDFTESDWHSMKEDFSMALTKFEVQPQEQKELQEILERARDRSVHED